MQRTFTPTPEHVERRWYIVDADGAVLGRLASHVASVLRGKHKPIWAPHIDTGDHVVVVNAAKVRLTGAKISSKVFYHHSGYPGGLREVEYERLLATRPAFAVEKAIKGMLPKNRLGRQMGRKLSVYPGAEHRHGAQRPVPLALGEVPPWTGLPEPQPKREPAREEPEAKPRRRRAASAPAPRGKAAGKKRTARAVPTRAAGSRSKAAPKKAASRSIATAAKKRTAKRSPRTKPGAKPSAKRTAKPNAKLNARPNAKKET